MRQIRSLQVLETVNLMAGGKTTRFSISTNQRFRLTTAPIESRSRTAWRTLAILTLESHAVRSRFPTLAHAEVTIILHMEMKRFI